VLAGSEVQGKAVKIETLCISKIFPMRQAGHMLYDKLQHPNWGQNKASIATYLQSMNMEEVSKVRSQD
jgi:hypothetical protein